MSSMDWYDLALQDSGLLLEGVLQVGQAFRWVHHEKSGEFACSLKISGYSDYGVTVLRQLDNNCLQFCYIHPAWQMEDVRDHLSQYFRLEVRLRDICLSDWKDLDVQDLDSGCRILKQDPWETLISFICSSNNNISRISRMCHNLAENYGTLVGTYNNLKYFSFPSSDDIVARATEDSLRKLGFGYRAKYIIETAKKLYQEKQLYSKHDISINNIPENDTKYIDAKKDISLVVDDDQYLTNLTRNMDYDQLREYLMSFTGVGPKVADCICLMGFKMDHIVPVDVHIGRIAKRDYKIAPTKNDLKLLREQYGQLPITKKKVNLELEYIRLQLLQKWGPFAGWAQGIVFSKEIGSTTGKSSEGTIRKRKRETIEDEVIDYIKKENKIQ